MPRKRKAPAYTVFGRNMRKGLRKTGVNPGRKAHPSSRWATGGGVMGRYKRGKR